MRATAVSEGDMNTLIAVDKSGSYRIYLTVATQLAEEARRIHQTSPTATAALGRSLIAAGLMGLMLKGDGDKLSLIFKGEGPAREILATADAKGRVKGYIASPDADLPPRADGHLNVGGLLAPGTLTVIKDLGLKEPYVGKIDLVNGEIAQDLTQYFAVSEQQPSSVALGVRLDENGCVEAAGGFIVQVLPNASDACLDKLEETLFLMDALTLLIRDTHEPKALLARIFRDMPDEFSPEILDERQISWNCDCSRERMERALISIGKRDLAQIIAEDGKAELTCQFCRKHYTFNEAELTALLKEASHE